MNDNNVNVLDQYEESRNTIWLNIHSQSNGTKIDAFFFKSQIIIYIIIKMMIKIKIITMMGTIMIIL